MPVTRRMISTIGAWVCSANVAITPMAGHCGSSIMAHKQIFHWMAGMRVLIVSPVTTGMHRGDSMCQLFVLTVIAQMMYMTDSSAGIATVAM